MKVRFFDPGLGYKKIKKEVDREITRVLTNGDLILRKDVEFFEKELAKFVGTRYAVGLNSGTDALYIILKALGIGTGDRVLVPSHTFVATAQVVAQVGAIPVLYDIGATVSSVDVKAVMVAHIAGDMNVREMKKLVEICQRRGIPVIEDACQALGAVQDGKKAGSFGIAGAFSFYPAKILGAYGDAGALVTNDRGIYKQALELRNHYKTDYSKWGINSRLDNIQAAVLRIKLRQLPQTLAQRKAIAEIYLNDLNGTGLHLPLDVKGRVWQDFVIETKNYIERDRLYLFLKENGVETMKNEYPFPIKKGEKSLKFEQQSLRLPCNENLTVQEVRYVVSMIYKFYDVVTR